MRDYHDLKKAVRLAYLYVQSHQPVTIEGKHHMPTSDPIGEINAVLTSYQTLLTNYNTLVGLYQNVTAQSDSASPDLQAAIDAADAFIVANPPPALPTLTAVTQTQPPALTPPATAPASPAPSSSDSAPTPNGGS
jgi:hypothetical protein